MQPSIPENVRIFVETETIPTLPNPTVLGFNCTDLVEMCFIPLIPEKLEKYDILYPDKMEEP